jgi:hypothetical protein
MITGNIVVGFSLVALDLFHHQRKTVRHIGEQPHSDLRFQPAFFGKTRLVGLISTISFKIQGSDSIEHEHSRLQASMSSTAMSQLLLEFNSYRIIVR